jgi:hypothetical protein
MKCNGVAVRECQIVVKASDNYEEMMKSDMQLHTKMEALQIPYPVCKKGAHRRTRQNVVRMIVYGEDENMLQTRLRGSKTIFKMSYHQNYNKQGHM